MIDDDISLEFLAIIVSQVRRPDAGLGVVGIHVQDRRLNRSRNVGAIDAASPVHGIRREADLVVNDDMNRAAGRIAIELRKLQNLGHDTLADERSVAVNQYRDDPFALGVAQTILLRPDQALRPPGSRLRDDWG